MFLVISIYTYTFLGVAFFSHIVSTITDSNKKLHIHTFKWALLIIICGPGVWVISILAGIYFIISSFLEYVLKIITPIIRNIFNKTINFFIKEKE